MNDRCSSLAEDFHNLPLRGWLSSKSGSSQLNDHVKDQIDLPLSEGATLMTSQ